MDNRSYQEVKTFQSPAFILGEERSGTTLLASILNRHPDICVTPETHYFQHLSAYPISWNEVLLDWPHAGEEFLCRLPKWYMLKLSESAIISNISAYNPSPGDLFYALGEAYCKKLSKSRWIEKTPFNIRHIPKIRELFPNAKFLYIIRDGRDVALSLCEVDWLWQTKSYTKNLLQWVESSRLSKKYLIPDPLTYHICYEELISNPEVIMQRVCEFLGLEYNNSILTPDGSEDSLIEPSTTCKDNNRKEIISNNSFKWKSKLSNGQTCLASMLAGEELEHWGYEVPQKENLYSKPILIPKRFFSLAQIDIDDILERLVQNNFYVRVLDDITVLQALKFSDSDCIAFGVSPSIDFVEVRFFERAIALVKIWLQLLRRKLANTRFILFFCGGNEKVDWRFRQMYDKALARHVDLVIYMNEDISVNDIEAEFSINCKKIASYKESNLNELIFDALCK